VTSPYESKEFRDTLKFGYRLFQLGLWTMLALIVIGGGLVGFGIYFLARMIERGF
jgi:hypothetical protein